MKLKTATLILLVFPALLYSQQKFLPIFDSTIACSYKNTSKYYDNMPNPLFKQKNKSEDLEIFYIVENMPKPVGTMDGFESIFEKSFTLSAQELTYQGNIILQCLINCQGQAGDYQIYSCPSELVNIGRQILHEFREKNMYWSPPIHKGYNVDLLAKIKVRVNKGKYEIVAPYY